MLYVYMKDVQLCCHVAEGELHDPIPTVDDCILCNQEWSPEYDRHIIGSYSHWLGIENKKVHQIVELIHLHQNIFNYALRIFTELSAKDKVMMVGFNSPNPNCL